MSEETRSLVAAASAALPSASEWSTMASVAEVLITSGLLPAHIKTPQAALAIMLKARELGVPTMHGLSTIVVVQGKPTCNGELMLALIYRDQGDEAIVIAETTAERCTISYKRRGWTERQTYSFTMEDARRAGLSSGQTWQKYPAAMLRARCISAVARMAFPDSIAGMYGYEEMGVSVDVEDGQVVVAPHAAESDGAANGHNTVATVATVAAGGTRATTPAARATGPTVTAPVPQPARTDQSAALRAEVAGLLQADTEAAGKLPKGADAMNEQELRKTRVWLRNRAAREQAPPPEPADEHDAPWPRSAADWTRAQLRQRIQESAGFALVSGKEWKALAHAHAQPDVASAAEMTHGWLLGLYQAMRAQLWAEAIAGASTEQAVMDLVSEALGERDRRQITAQQYGELSQAGEARKAELSAPLLSGSRAQVAS